MPTTVLLPPPDLPRPPPPPLAPPPPLPPPRRDPERPLSGDLSSRRGSGARSGAVRAGSGCCGASLTCAGASVLSACGAGALSALEREVRPRVRRAGLSSDLAAGLVSGDAVVSSSVGEVP